MRAAGGGGIWRQRASFFRGKRQSAATGRRADVCPIVLSIVLANEGVTPDLGRHPPDAKLDSLLNDLIL